MNILIQIFIFGLLITNCIKAQNNLISNGQFDLFVADVNYSSYSGVFLFDPLNRNPWEVIPYWNGYWNSTRTTYTITLPNGGTPDVFKSKCDISYGTDVTIYPCNLNGNFAGKQRPSELNSNANCTNPNIMNAGYAGIGYLFSYNNKNRLKINNQNQGYQYAEYLMQKLENKLEVNHLYKFSFKISRARNDIIFFNEGEIPINLKYFGAIFTTESNKIPFTSFSKINGGPINYNKWDGIKILNTTTLDKQGDLNNSTYSHWMTVEGYFIACDEYEYVYLGHFNNDIQFEIDNYLCNTDTSYACYYFIDDVELYDVTNTVSCAYDSTPHCNYNCNYNIITETLPVSLPSCYEDLCRTQISIQRDSNDCEYEIEFVKVIITYSGNNYSSDIILLDSVKRQLWRTYQPVQVYDFFYPDSLISSYYSVTTKLFKRGELDTNNNAICIGNPGMWFAERSSNFTAECQCICGPAEGFSKILFEKDTADCCYNLKVLHLESCDLLIDDISIEVSKINKDGQLVQIVENDFFSYTSLETGWNMNVPFYDISAYKINKSQPKYIAKNAGVVDIGKFCFPDDGNKYNVIISINTQSTHCKSDDFIVQCLPPDIPCCEPISAHVSGNPLWADGDRCCYALLINLPDSLPCVTEDVEIWSEVSNKRLTRISPISSGISQHEFCVDIEEFGESTSLPIQIRFREQDSASYFCIKLDTLKACEYIPLPCTPDSLNVPWKGPDEADVLFYCPGSNPPQLCYIKFSFVYRLVEDENGDPLHRDVQVIKTEGLSQCPCEEEAIKQMLERMWKDINVINEFKLPETLNWPVGDTMCFTNFRVITSDCWSQYTVYSFDSLGNPVTKTIRQPCDSVECCYAVYKVCYKKLPDDVIDYLGFERIAQNSPLIQQCNGWDAYPPCLGANCNKWLISGPVQQLIYTDIKKYSGERCNVYVALRKDLTNILNIECDVNGSVTIEMIDLMGRTVMNVDFIKNSFSYILPLRDNLPAGTYLLRIKINNELLFFNKINIMN